MSLVLGQSSNDLSGSISALSLSTNSSRLLQLPRELRDQIYDFVFASNSPRILCYPTNTEILVKEISLLRASKWIWNEAIRLCFLNTNFIFYNPGPKEDYGRPFNPKFQWDHIQNVQIVANICCGCPRYGRGRNCGCDGRAGSLLGEIQTLYLEELIEKVGHCKNLRRRCDIMISGYYWSRYTRVLAMRLLKKAAILTGFKNVSIHFHCPPEMWAKPVDEEDERIKVCLTSTLHINYEISEEMWKTIDYLEARLGSSTTHRIGPFRRLDFHPYGAKLRGNP